MKGKLKRPNSISIIFCLLPLKEKRKNYFILKENKFVSIAFQNGNVNFEN